MRRRSEKEEVGKFSVQDSVDKQRRITCVSPSMPFQYKIKFMTFTAVERHD